MHVNRNYWDKNKDSSGTRYYFYSPISLPLQCGPAEYLDKGIDAMVVIVL